jgi:hypothetical protein
LFGNHKMPPDMHVEPPKSSVFSTTSAFLPRLLARSAATTPAPLPTTRRSVL